jgi:hypothetical protein
MKYLLSIILNVSVGQNVQSVKIAVAQKCRRSKMPSGKNVVGQNGRRSKIPSVKMAVGQKWPGTVKDIKVLIIIKITSRLNTKSHVLTIKEVIL